jgi:hypothetical protein
MEDSSVRKKSLGKEKLKPKTISSPIGEKFRILEPEMK